MKSTVDEIRARFDKEVERFSVLETGQTATMDAPLVLEMVCAAASAVTPTAKRLVDVGCGAGNFSLKLLEKLPGLEVTLVDLSGAMLERARQRVSAATSGAVKVWQGDIREMQMAEGSADIILAAAVLHHLRSDQEWAGVFGKFFRALPSGGSLWIADLVEHEIPAVQEQMWKRYGEYLEKLGGAEYREKVFAYVQKEDTPRSLTFQMEQLRRAGFRSVEVLHKTAVFAAFGGVK